MPTEDDARGGLSPDDSRQDQPERDDLIDPDEVEGGLDIDPTSEQREGDQLPRGEERPESQGYDVLDAPHETEDDATGRLLSDEEAERDPVAGDRGEVDDEEPLPEDGWAPMGDEEE